MKKWENSKGCYWYGAIDPWLYVCNNKIGLLIGWFVFGYTEELYKGGWSTEGADKNGKKVWKS